VSKKRILLHAFESLDGDFVRRLVGGEPDMEVVGEVDADGDLVAAVASSHADVVIASTPATGLTDSCQRLLAESTKLRVFAFAPPDPGSVFELHSHERELSGEVTPGTLVRTIRGAA
jgi:hypothetical protein